MDDQPPSAFVPAGGAQGIGRRAVSGVVWLTGRGVAVRLVSLLAYVVLARLIAPSELGVLAIALTVMTFVMFVVDAGVAAAFIRRSTAPSVQELRAALGLQLVLSVGLLVLSAPLAAVVGRQGLVVLIVIASIPLAVARLPAKILLEREMRYGPLAVAEVVEILAYYAWAILGVWLGGGIWALATASVFSALVASAALFVIFPAGRMLPEWRFALVRPLLMFGVPAQMVLVSYGVRDQLLLVGTAVTAGTAVVGLWALALRVLQAPLILFEALRRVSLPALSRVSESDEDPVHILPRVTAVAVAVAGLVLAPLIGASSGLVPLLFGDKWAPAAEAVPLSGIGLIVGGSVAAMASGYLFARGRPGMVVVAAVVQSMVWLVIGVALVGDWGVEGLSLGWCVASIVEAGFLVVVIGRRFDVWVFPSVLPEIAVCLFASAAGWWLATLPSGNLGSAGLGGGAALLTAVVGLRLIARATMSDMVSLLRGVLHGRGDLIARRPPSGRVAAGNDLRRQRIGED